MRLLQAMAGAQEGGAENFFTRLVCAVQKQGLSQDVLMRPHSFRETIFKEAGVSFKTLPFKGPLDFYTRYHFFKAIHSFAPHIVLTWMNRATQFCPSSFKNREKQFIHVARLGGYYNLKYYRKCDYLIGNTKDLVAYFLKEGWPEERVCYLPNFVNSPSKAPAFSRANYQTPKDAPLALALGRFHPNKGFDVLLKALQKVSTLYLWLAGSGPLESDLKALAKDLKIEDRVRFIGWQQETSPLFKAADLFICPSRHEPLGNVILEAWAHKVPVISTKNQGACELIGSSENGILAPLDDPDSLADTLNTLIEDKARQASLSQKGYETYIKNYTEERVTKAYLDFFTQILKETPLNKRRAF